jgi:hypothetical protein
MRPKRFPPEKVIAEPREVGLLCAQGKPAAEVVKTPGVSEVTGHHRREKHGGMSVTRARRRSPNACERTDGGRAPADAIGI